MMEDTSDVAGLFNIPAAIQNVVKKFGVDLQISIPVIVTGGYNNENNSITVRPIPKSAHQDGDKVVFKEFDEFPVQLLRHGAGKFAEVIPISVGDTGWVISSDRDTFGIREKNSNIDVGDNEGPQDTHTFDMGKYTQGFFIPDRWIADGNSNLRLGPSSSGLEGAIGIRVVNTEKDIGIFLSEDGTVTIANGDKTLRVNMDSLPDEETVELQETWIPKDIGDDYVTFAKVFAVRGSKETEAKRITYVHRNE